MGSLIQGTIDQQQCRESLQSRCDSIVATCERQGNIFFQHLVVLLAVASSSEIPMVVKFSLSELGCKRSLNNLKGYSRVLVQCSKRLKVSSLLHFSFIFRLTSEFFVVFLRGCFLKRMCARTKSVRKTGKVLTASSVANAQHHICLNGLSIQFVKCNGR